MARCGTIGERGNTGHFGAQSDMSSHDFNPDEQSTDLPETAKRPNPLPSVGMMFRQSPDTDMDEACLGTLTKFADGSVVIRTYDHINQNVREGVAFYDDEESALVDMTEAFPADDVWFDWDVQ